MAAAWRLRVHGREAVGVAGATRREEDEQAAVLDFSRTKQVEIVTWRKELFENMTGYRKIFKRDDKKDK